MRWEALFLQNVVIVSEVKSMFPRQLNVYSISEGNFALRYAPRKNAAGQDYEVGKKVIRARRGLAPVPNVS